MNKRIVTFTLFTTGGLLLLNLFLAPHHPLRGLLISLALLLPALGLTVTVLTDPDWPRSSVDLILIAISSTLSSICIIVWTNKDMQTFRESPWTCLLDPRYNPRWAIVKQSDRPNWGYRDGSGGFIAGFTNLQDAIQERDRLRHPQDPPAPPKPKPSWIVVAP